jgi:hypothetical protein
MSTFDDVVDMSVLARASTLIAAHPSPHAGGWAAELTFTAYAIELGQPYNRTLVEFARVLVATAPEPASCTQCGRPYSFCRCP